jgi:hypothetical protein
MPQENNENNEFTQWTAKHKSKRKMPLWGWVILAIIGSAILKESIHFMNAKNGWSPKHTKDVYNSLNEGLNKFATDSTSKKNLINCVITKLKNKYPEGLEFVNDDSLQNTTAKFSSVCMVETNINLGWTPMIDKILRNKLMETASIKNLSNENQTAYCNCYIKTLKQLYPDGLKESLSKSTNDSISVLCSKVIK